jgi:quercetin dioxygenase-like cupin family protein
VSAIRRFRPGADGDYAWESVERLRYKDEGTAPFRDITRQVLFAQPDHATELRYFEVAPGGYSTLERHHHTHAVLILRGHGSVRIDNEEHLLVERDLVTVDPMVWHQFRAAPDAPLGFLCLVPTERDRPQLPGEDEPAGAQQLRAMSARSARATGDARPCRWRCAACLHRR